LLPGGASPVATNLLINYLCDLMEKCNMQHMWIQLLETIYFSVNQN